MKFGKCPACGRIIDLDTIMELDENTVIGCGGGEGNFLPCRECPHTIDPVMCAWIRNAKHLTQTTIKDFDGDLSW